MASFEAGEQRWTDRLDNLRNTIRQEVIARQLAEHVPQVRPCSTSAAARAPRLCAWPGPDAGSPAWMPRPACLARFQADADAAGVPVELIHGQVERLGDLVGERRFDVVCAHGLLMYLDDRAAAVATLADQLGGPAAILSLTFRNAHGLAARPGYRRDWAGALAAFDTDTYVNELGVTARADRLDDVCADLSAVGLEVVEWYGVRVFNDAVGADLRVPADEDLALLLDAEDQAGRRDPYRWMASQLHVIARRA